MIKKFLNKNNFNKIVFITILTSFFASLLSSLRVMLTGYEEHFFINWNILLSLFSLFFALLFFYLKNKNKNILKTVIIWISLIISFVFLPNSPYLVTDTTHLSKDLTYRWYDTVLFFTAALSGIMVYSNIIWIYFIKIKRKFSKIIAYIAVVLISILNSFGIYLGRTYELFDNNGDRFNSWDLIARPKILFHKISDVILHPFSYSDFSYLFLGFSLLLIFVSIMTIFISKMFNNNNNRLK